MPIKKGLESEKRGAKEYGARLQPNSGSLPTAKGDFLLKFSRMVSGWDGILFQNKATKKKSYSIKVKDLEEIRDQAMGDNYIPAFRIDFEGAGNYIIIPEWVFKAIMEEWK